jgi:DNA-binding MarR family transcriptional regulator
MDDPTASRVVKAMVELGLLRTRPDPKHGRRILISLTASSALLAQELQGLAAEIKSGLVMGLGADQQEALRLGLLAMVTNLDGMLAGIPSSSPGDAAAAS